ncbi:hypothetical protein FACS189476_00290 [Spirochaetia bacterium]|nr:hypothetical protein FACS189476_00290 [Spirochaetia bacterium]
MTDAELEALPPLPEGVLPFESWERLKGESSAAFAAFCAYRDFGPERNIRRAAEKIEADSGKAAKRYRLWRGWVAAHRWRERAADYDAYVDKLKQAEVRKAIEEQGKADRELFGKMKQVAGKKLDSMNPADLGTGVLPVWVTTAVRLDREAVNQRFIGVVTGADKSDERIDKNGQITFIPEFEGL